MNEERHAVLMNLPDGIILIEQLSGNISLINEEFKRIFGICSGESGDEL